MLVVEKNSRSSATFAVSGCILAARIMVDVSRSPNRAGDPCCRQTADNSQQGYQT
ncbi:hypothetical protein Plhal703r1_c06g0032171 [Plasmopara halstedii]